jgi:hypothetical protein
MKLNLILSRTDWTAFDDPSFNFIATEEKIQHNHNHFFNSTLVKQRLINELFNPIMDFFEKN